MANLTRRTKEITRAGNWREKIINLFFGYVTVPCKTAATHLYRSYRSPNKVVRARQDFQTTKTFEKRSKQALHSLAGGESVHRKW